MTESPNAEASSRDKNVYFHNIESAEIVRSRSKPADLKVKREIHLTIANRQARLLRALTCTDAQMHVVDGLRVMRSKKRVKGNFLPAMPRHQ
jgi:hypothetical protein